MTKSATMLSAVCLIAFLSVQPADAQEKTTFADFQQFGDTLKGRWTGDITFIADWPGEKKKQGDKIVNYASYRWILDGKAIEWDAVGGMSVGKTLLTYDATEKVIRAFHAGSDGGHWQTVIWKKSDNEWAWKATTGGTVDGRKLRGEGSWVIKDGGKTHVVQGDVTLGGEKLPKLNDIYTRISK